MPAPPRRLRPLPIYSQSLKDGESAGLIADLFAAAPPSVILNATGFSVGVSRLLAALQAIIARSRTNLRARRNLADDDERFHLALIAASKNPILLRIGKSLYLMTRSIRRAYFQAPGSGAQSIKDHEKILKAVAQGDAAQAAQLVKHHYAASSARWRKAYAAGH